MNSDHQPVNQQEGGEAELAAFLLEHWDYLFNMINAKMRNNHAADDIRQDTAMAITAIWREHGGLKVQGLPVDNPVAFLFGIARKKIQKYYRDNQAKFRSLQGANTEDESADPAAEAALDAIEGESDCQRALQRLPFRRRQAVWLVDIVGFPQAKAAAFLDISVSALQQRLAAGRSEYAAHLATAGQAPVQSEPQKEDTR